MQKDQRLCVVDVSPVALVTQKLSKDVIAYSVTEARQMYHMLYIANMTPGVLPLSSNREGDVLLAAVVLVVVPTVTHAHHRC